MTTERKLSCSRPAFSCSAGLAFHCARGVCSRIAPLLFIHRPICCVRCPAYRESSCPQLGLHVFVITCSSPRLQANAIGRCPEQICCCPALSSSTPHLRARQLVSSQVALLVAVSQQSRQVANNPHPQSSKHRILVCRRRPLRVGRERTMPVSHALLRCDLPSDTYRGAFD
jgi:hypothetical protein